LRPRARGQLLCVHEPLSRQAGVSRAITIVATSALGLADDGSAAATLAITRLVRVA
jgi:hypothetical protein